jgi:two-component system, NtrC family, sensor histidine kinase HydH
MIRGHIRRLDRESGMDHDDFGEMVSLLAHEVRNPLATIKSSAQLIKRLRMPPDALPPYLDDFVDQVSRIDRVVKEIERLATIRRGAIRELAVSEVARASIEDCRARAHDAEVAVRLIDGAEAIISSDPRLVRLALSELLANAIQVSAPGSTVEVNPERTPDNRICIHVDDTGPGVADEIADRIQRPFFTTSRQNVGLGLNVVLRICRLLESHLQWQNRNGSGCRFSLILPGA